MQARNIVSGIKEFHMPAGLEQQEIRGFGTLMVWFQSMELSEGHQSWSARLWLRACASMQIMSICWKILCIFSLSPRAMIVIKTRLGFLLFAGLVPRFSGAARQNRDQIAIRRKPCHIHSVLSEHRRRKVVRLGSTGTWGWICKVKARPLINSANKALINT